MPSVLLVRHAQASFGAADYDVLSDRGEQQVEALGAVFEERGTRVDRLLSGSLRRQRDSAKPWLAGGRELEVDPRWDEYDSAGVLGAHGSVPASLEQAPGGDAPAVSSREFQTVLDEALRGWIAAGAEGAAGEDWPAFRSRAVAALDELVATLGSGETAVVVTSGGPIAALCVALLGLPDEAFVAFNRVAINGAITKLVSGRSGTTLVSFNEHAHLEPAGLVTYR